MNEDKIDLLMRTAISVARAKPKDKNSYDYLVTVWSNFCDVYPDWFMFCNEVAGLVPTTEVRKMAQIIIRNGLGHGFKNRNRSQR